MKYILIFLSLTFPFLALAGEDDTRHVRDGYNSNLAEPCYNVKSGMIIDYTLIKACDNGFTFSSGSKTFTITSTSITSSQLRVAVKDNFGYKYSGYFALSIRACELPKEINPDNGICEEACPEGTQKYQGECLTTCQILAKDSSPRRLRWDATIYGENPSSFCKGSGDNGCWLNAAGLFISVEDNFWSGDFTFTSESCQTSDIGKFFGGTKFPPTDTPDPDPNPDDGNPDTAPIPDADPFPDGSASGPSPTPEPVDPTAPVEQPNPTPNQGDNGDVVKAVTNLNSDVNKALNDLNIDINKSQERLRLEVYNVSARVHHNTEAIKGLHTATKVGFENVQSYLGSMDSTLDGMSTNIDAIAGDADAIRKGVIGIGDSLDDIEGTLNGIEGTLDGIANTDTSGAGTGGTCIASNSCTGFYQSGYPNGIGDAVGGGMNNIKGLVQNGLLNQFGNIDLSNAAKPDFVLDLSGFGFTKYNLESYVNFNYVFMFIRVCVLFTAGMTCRKIIFGG